MHQVGPSGASTPGAQPAPAAAAAVDATVAATVDTQRHLALVLANAPIILWAVDLDGTIRLSQGKGLAGLGIASGEDVGKSLWELYADYPQVLADIRRAMAGETILATNDVGGTSFDSYVAPLRDETGAICGVQGVSTDITERVKFERALERRVEFERLVSQISSRFIRLEPHEYHAAIETSLGEICQFSAVDRGYVCLLRGGLDGHSMSAEALYDVTHEWCAPGIASHRKQFQGLRVGEHTPWFERTILGGDIVHVPSLAALPAEAAQERARMQARGVQSVLIVPVRVGAHLIGCVGFEAMRRETSWCDTSIALLKLTGEIFASALLHQRDTETILRARAELEQRVAQRTAELSRAVESLQSQVAQRQQAENELRTERLLLEKLLSAHERDRKLVAYEIHDGLAQNLAGTLMHLESFWDRHETQHPEDAPQMERSIDLLRSTINEARRMISGLRPPILDEMGMVEAIAYLINDKNLDAPADLEIEFDHDVRFNRVAPILEGGVFRIVQEALTNVVRHSQAKNARITLQHDEKTLFLEVRDWGVGFVVGDVVEHRFGLQGIRERAALLHGQAEIVSFPGQGTTLKVELPITHALQYSP